MQYPFDKLPPITSPYGWRVHPTQGTKRHHNGTDFGARSGVWTEAIADGMVIHAGPSKVLKPNGEPGGFGYYVLLRFWDAKTKAWCVANYAHLIKGSIQVKVGEKVKEGKPLGKVGATGDVTGPHLHFEVCKGKNYTWSNDGSTYYNPMTFLKARVK
jgi:murein DD-endopeptidase MepM/ murein hydrolase activator NlpD